MPSRTAVVETCWLARLAIRRTVLVYTRMLRDPRGDGAGVGPRQ